MVAKIEQKPARALLAIALTLTLIATGCAAVVRASSAGVGTGVERPQVVHDPDNPYWRGATRIDEADGSPTVHVVKDPDNPYWRGSTASSIDSTASESSYAEPVRGPR